MERRFWNWCGRGYGSRFAPRKANTWEAEPAAAPVFYSGRKAYRKVLKHRPLELCQFRAVSRSAGRDSLGKEMGKPLGKTVQTIGDRPKCFLAYLTHLMYMPAGRWCDTNPFSWPCRDGVCS